MQKNTTGAKTVITSIEPWLTVYESEKAIRFYTEAFAATETYHTDVPGGGLVVRFAVEGAAFWISYSPDTQDAVAAEEKSIKIILIVQDPDRLFAQALQAGAIEIFPVGEEYGWRLGKLADPYGHHWEIGRQLD